MSPESPGFSRSTIRLVMRSAKWRLPASAVTRPVRCAPEHRAGQSDGARWHRGSGSGGRRWPGSGGRASVRSSTGRVSRSSRSPPGDPEASLRRSATTSESMVTESPSEVRQGLDGPHSARRARAPRRRRRGSRSCRRARGCSQVPPTCHVGAQGPAHPAEVAGERLDARRDRCCPRWRAPGAGRRPGGAAPASSARSSGSCASTRSTGWPGPPQQQVGVEPAVGVVDDALDERRPEFPERRDPESDPVPWSVGARGGAADGEVQLDRAGDARRIELQQGIHVPQIDAQAPLTSRSPGTERGTLPARRARPEPSLALEGDADEQRPGRPRARDGGRAGEAPIVARERGHQAVDAAARWRVAVGQYLPAARDGAPARRGGRCATSGASPGSRPAPRRDPRTPTAPSTRVGPERGADLGPLGAVPAEAQPPAAGARMPRQPQPLPAGPDQQPRRARAAQRSTSPVSRPWTSVGGATLSAGGPVKRLSRASNGARLSALKLSVDLLARSAPASAAARPPPGRRPASRPRGCRAAAHRRRRARGRGACRA